LFLACTTANKPNTNKTKILEGNYTQKQLTKSKMKQLGKQLGINFTPIGSLVIEMNLNQDATFQIMLCDQKVRCSGLWSSDEKNIYFNVLETIDSFITDFKLIHEKGLIYFPSHLIVPEKYFNGDISDTLISVLYRK
jgi:hypothetical protein